MFQAEVHHSSNDETAKILICEVGRFLERGKNVEYGLAALVGHRRQIDERLDWSLPELAPNSVILLAHFCIRRMHRQLNADASQVFEPCFNGTLVLIYAGVKFGLEACDGCPVDKTGSAACQHREPLFGHRKIARQKLTFGALYFQRKRQLIELLPTVFR